MSVICLYCCSSEPYPCPAPSRPRRWALARGIIVRQPAELVVVGSNPSSVRIAGQFRFTSSPHRYRARNVKYPLVFSPCARESILYGCLNIVIRRVGGKIIAAYAPPFFVASFKLYLTCVVNSCYQPFIVFNLYYIFHLGPQPIDILVF